MFIKIDLILNFLLTMSSTQNLKLEIDNSHQRDKRIVFVEDGHKYYIDGDDNYLSVTTFVHEFFPKFNSDKIIEHVKKNNNEKYIDLEPEDIKEMWAKNGTESAEAGTLMHLNIELYSNDVPVNDSSPEFEQFLQFRHDFPYLQPYRTEWTLFDTEYRLAGSIDMVYLDTRDGSYNIYDWKRTKDFKNTGFKGEMGFYPLNHLPNANKWHYFLQLNTYKHLIEKNYDIQIKDLYLCRCHPNNKNGYELLKSIDLSSEVNEIVNLRKDQVDQEIFEFILPENPTINTQQELQSDSNSDILIPKGVCLLD